MSDSFRIPAARNPEGRLTDVEVALQAHGPFILHRFFAAARERFTINRGKVFCRDPEHAPYTFADWDELYYWVQDHWDCPETPMQRLEKSAAREGDAIDAARAAYEDRA